MSGHETLSWVGGILGAALLVLVACSPGSDGSETAAASTTTTSPASVRLRQLDDPAVVVAGVDSAQLALAASRTLFEVAPVAVVAPSNDDAMVRRAGRLAERHRVPLLLTSVRVPAGAVGRELDRLGVHTTVVFGSATPLSNSLDNDVEVIDGAPGRDALPDVGADSRPAGVVALIDRADPIVGPAAVSVRAAGIPVVAVDGGDPRLAAESRRELAQLKPSRILALGGAGRFPPAASLAGLVRTVLGGTELPAGGQVMFPGRRLVALYGHPGAPVLGALGEQAVDSAVDRAASVAAEYRAHSREPLVPTFEVIATVASAAAGTDGDYSLESELDQLRPWVEAAAANDMYVVLDLQPGHTDFLTQAKRYEELLRESHVGLALDPEWRLAPGQRHLRQIGSVAAEEVTATIAWVADLVRTHHLPQKLVVVHQFQPEMIRRREIIRPVPEVAILFQMDGNGSQSAKVDSWHAVTAELPSGTWLGWKNFYDEDFPTRSPADTLAIEPAPLYISYQ